MSATQDFRARVVVPLILALAMLKKTADATVLATALPVLSLKLALSAYLIAFAAMVPVSG